MIAAIAWARKGVPAAVPKTEDAMARELEQLREGQQAEADAAAAAASEASRKQAASGKRSGSDRSRGVANSDESDEDDAPLPSLVSNLAYYKSNQEDPNLQLRENDDNDSEMDDLTLEETDLVLIAARSEEEFSNLEVNVFEEPVGNLYTHHDIPLPVFPLCLAWMDCIPAPRIGASELITANMVAVGTFAPFIEIWNLDVLDALEPTAVLGAEGSLAAEEHASAAAAAAVAAQGRAAKPSKRGKKAKAERPAEGHTDAVMALAWNSVQRNILASGSADHTVRLWDLTGDHGQSLLALRHHLDKVQALAWNPAEPTLLLSAGFDRRVCAVDVRVQESVRSWALTADGEAVAWDPHNPHAFAVSAEDGSVCCYDARSQTSAVWEMRAHKKAASCLSFNPAASGVLATGSVDRTIKLWSVDGAEPSLLASHDAGVGKVFCVSFCPDSPALIAAGGSKGKAAVWNTLENETMQQRLPNLEAAIGVDGRVLGGATAGMGALDINSSDDEEDEAAPNAAMPSEAAAHAFQDDEDAGGGGAGFAAGSRAGPSDESRRVVARKKKKPVKVGGKPRGKKR